LTAAIKKEEQHTAGYGTNKVTQPGKKKFLQASNFDSCDKKKKSRKKEKQHSTGYRTNNATQIYAC
jgi:hypothetical protein